jgi:response regulator NasT
MAVGYRDGGSRFRAMPDTRLTIAIIDATQVRTAILEDGLRAAGPVDVAVISHTGNLRRQLAEIDPDVVIIDLENPSRDVLEQMLQVSREVARPVAMFVDQSSTAMMEAAIDAGVSAYVVDGLKSERVRSIVDLAITRFNAFSRLQRELEAARFELAERKLIDRAKGILMKTRRLTEEEAYELMRKTAMNQNRKVADIARSVLTAAELLHP